MQLELTTARSGLSNGSVCFLSLLSLFNKSKPVSAVPGWYHTLPPGLRLLQTCHLHQRFALFISQWVQFTQETHPLSKEYKIQYNVQIALLQETFVQSMFPEHLLCLPMQNVMFMETPSSHCNSLNCFVAVLWSSSSCSQSQPFQVLLYPKQEVYKLYFLSLKKNIDNSHKLKDEILKPLLKKKMLLSHSFMNYSQAMMFLSFFIGSNCPECTMQTHKLKGARQRGTGNFQSH